MTGKMDFRDELFLEISTPFMKRKVEIRNEEVFEIVDAVENIAITMMREKTDELHRTYLTKEQKSYYEQKLAESAEYAESLKRQLDTTRQHVLELTKDKESLQHEINELEKFRDTSTVTPEMFQSMGNEIAFLRDLAMEHAKSKRGMFR